MHEQQGKTFHYHSASQENAYEILALLLFSQILAVRLLLCPFLMMLVNPPAYPLLPLIS